VTAQYPVLATPVWDHLAVPGGRASSASRRERPDLRRCARERVADCGGRQVVERCMISLPLPGHETFPSRPTAAGLRLANRDGRPAADTRSVVSVP